MSKIEKSYIGGICVHDILKRNETQHLDNAGYEENVTKLNVNDKRRKKRDQA